MLTKGPPLVLFSTDHVATLLLILGLAVALPFLVRKVRSTALARSIEWTMAVGLVVNEILKAYLWIVLAHYPWRWMLPLHLCSLAVVLTAWLLIRRQGQRMYEVVYFWGIGGTLQALFTPDIPYGFPHPFYVTYFISHGLIVIGVIYITLVFEMRPTLDSIRRVFLLTAAYALLFIFPLNYLIDANYLYLRAKPSKASLMDFMGPWPWYIGSLALVATFLFFVCYAPFALSDALARRRAAREAQSR